MARTTAVINCLDSLFIENLFNDFKNKRKAMGEETAFKETIKEFAIYLLNRARVPHKLSDTERVSDRLTDVK